MKATPVFNGKSVGRSDKDSGEDSGIYSQTFSDDDDDLRVLHSRGLDKLMGMGMLKPLDD